MSLKHFSVAEMASEHKRRQHGPPGVITSVVKANKNYKNQ
jgi:hypothetical protein